MSAFTINDSKEYIQSQTAVFQAALGAINGLEGKVTTQDAASGQIEAKFDKKILGKVLGDRTHFAAMISSEGGKTAVSVEVYPLDAVGRPLMFGARKGVSRTVANWFFAHLEHRLGN